MKTETKKPWRIKKLSRLRVFIEGHDGRAVARLATGYTGARKSQEQIEADAQLIVRAVNAHDDLVEALKNVCKGGWHDPDCPATDGDDTTCDCGMAARYAAADAALSRATQ